MFFPIYYEKLLLSVSGEIVKTEFIVEGRKHPLFEIRTRMLENHDKYMRDRSDQDFADMSCEMVAKMLQDLNKFKEGESGDQMRACLKKLERTRHIKLWHDLSTMANHGHLVFMVSCIYDPAVYYTNDEYQQKTGIKEDIQAKVESPEVYIIARSGSSDVQQLAYIETRLEYLEDMVVSKHQVWKSYHRYNALLSW